MRDARLRTGGGRSIGGVIALVLALALVAPSCASLDVVPADRLHGQTLVNGATPIAHVRASNWGWYLFKFIPIWTGDLDRAKYPQLCDWFHDNVTVDDVTGKVTETAEKLGGNLTTDLQTIDKSSYQAWTIFFWLNEIEVSGNVSKR